MLEFLPLCWVWWSVPLWNPSPVLVLNPRAGRFYWIHSPVSPICREAETHTYPVGTISTDTQIKQRVSAVSRKTKATQLSTSTVPHTVSQRQHLVLAWTAYAAEGWGTSIGQANTVNTLEGKLWCSVLYLLLWMYMLLTGLNVFLTLSVKVILLYSLRGEDIDRHFTLKPPSHCLLEMVLQSHVEIKSVPSVPEANSYESTATCGRQVVTLQWLTPTTAKIKFFVLRIRFRGLETGKLWHSSFSYHPHRYHPVSAEQSIGWSRWPFPSQHRDTPWLVPGQTAPLQDTRGKDKR